MAETIATFQSQLSGVMETVFKAAMYEITRLVEDSFLEEMNRCREQVESLKKRLKWSETKRKEDGDGRARCKDCGRRGGSGKEETGESCGSFPPPTHPSIPPSLLHKADCAHYLFYSPFPVLLKEERMLHEEIHSPQDRTDGETSHQTEEAPKVEKN